MPNYEELQEKIRQKILELKSELDFLQIQKIVLDFEIISDPSANNSKRIYQKNFRKLTIIDTKIDKINLDLKFLQKKIIEFRERF